MPQLTIYLDEETARLLEHAAEAEGVSRSSLAADAIRRRLTPRFSEEWLANLGTWEDDRTPEDILAEIRRSDVPQPDREPLA